MDEQGRGKGFEQDYDEEKAANKALEASGRETKAADDRQRTALAKLIIDIINAILEILGIKARFVGGSWKPPAPKQVAKQAAADEMQKHAVDTPREVLRIGRRIEMGAEIDGARLSEPVLGALLTMSKPDLRHLINRNTDQIDKWTAVQQGVAAPDRAPNPRIVHARQLSDHELRRQQGWSDNVDAAEEGYYAPSFAR